MAKTNPIGVRFDETLLAKLKEMGYPTPQRALSFLEAFWAKNIGKIVEINNQPENKKRILQEREGGDTYEQRERKERIAQLEKELQNPEKNPQIGQRRWIAIRQQELEKLKNQ